MSDPFIRLQNYRSYFSGGKGWAEYSTSNPKEVFVAIILGVEPKKIERPDQYANVDDVILQMAENIKANRKSDTLFDMNEPPKPRAKRRVLMRVSDAGCGEELPCNVHLVCEKCGHDAGWMEVKTVTEAKHQPCPVCNKEQP